MSGSEGGGRTQSFAKKLPACGEVDGAGEMLPKGDTPGPKHQAVLPAAGAPETRHQPVVEPAAPPPPSRAALSRVLFLDPERGVLLRGEGQSQVAEPVPRHLAICISSPSQGRNLPKT